MTPKDRKNINNTSDFENKPAVQKDSILDTEVKLTSELTYPNCAYKKAETMPTNICQLPYEREQCHTLLKSKQGGGCCCAAMDTSYLGIRRRCYSRYQRAT